MRMNKLLSILPSKWKFAAILALSFAYMFKVLVFTPLDLYINNPTGFTVSWKFFMPSLLATALIGFIGLVLAFIMLWQRKTWLGVTLLFLLAVPFIYFRFVRFQLKNLSIYVFVAIAIGIVAWILLTKLLKHKAVDAVLLVLWGGFIIAYVQELFLNGNMVLITGDKASYSSLTLGHICNALLWIGVTLLPLCIWLYLRRKGKEFHFEKPLVVSVLIICATHCVGIAATAATTKLPVGYEDEPKYLSYVPAMNYSAGNNVCVFLLDRLDVQYMSEVLDNYPELYEQLDGFTFYKNNVAEFGGTFPSVPKMLTGYYYTDGQTFSEYWADAWSQHTPIDILRENGFTTNLLIDRRTTYGTFDNIDTRTDNIELGEAVLFYKGMMGGVCRLSLGRLAPYLIKNFFLAPIGSDFGNTFFNVAVSDGQNLVVGVNSDRAFYNYVTSAIMTADGEKPAFNFIHLNCSHADWDKNITSGGYHYDEEKGVLADGGNYIEATRGCFEILRMYIDKMKAANVYDNTTLILLGDHGRRLSEKDDSPVCTGLFIKPQNAKGNLKIDTETELSNKYFGASILEAAGLPHKELGLSYFDIISGEPAPVRKYYAYDSWWDARNKSESIFLKGIYEISGDASKWENWIYTEKDALHNTKGEPAQ